MFTKNAFNGKADPVADSIKAIAEADYALKMEALKGGQVKLDKNKNNKLDADDFKILRGKKKVNEADEKPRSAGSVFDKDVAKSYEKKKPGESTGHEAKKTSTGTVYTKKAPKPEETNESFSSFKDKLKSGAKKVLAKVGGGSDEDQLKRLQKNMGVPQTGKKPEVKEEFDLEAIDPALVEEFMQTEEFEQLDELSKKTLSSYVKKSSDDLGYHAARVAGGVKDVARHGGKNTPIGKELQKDVEKSVHIRDKRSSGIDKAATKLAKEEVEEINELKKSTLASYVNKAKQDNKDYADSRRSGDKDEAKWAKDRMVKRSTGIGAAQNRLNKEEAEQIDELSKETLKSYKKKADSEFADEIFKTPDTNDIRGNSKAMKRFHGMMAAGKRLKKEEVEQVDEISKELANRYMYSAFTDRKKTDDEMFALRDRQDTLGHNNRNKISKRLKRSDKRTTGISRALNRITKEEVEQIDELSKDTLKSYQDKAMKTPPSKNGNWVNRIAGIGRSAEKLKKEEVDQIEERELTAGEKAEREKNVKGMKKSAAGFKARYGSRAKEVMYATATKMAKEEVEQIEELSKGTLSSYANKSATDAVDNLAKAHEFKSISDRIKTRPPGKVGDNLMNRASKLEEKHQDKANKRTAGFIKATTRLKKKD